VRFGTQFPFATLTQKWRHASEKERSLGTARPKRKDAQRNRETLLAAARAAFSEDGLDTPLEGVARRAGLGIGTLYRHFPTRLDLIEATFGEELVSWIEAGEQALAMPDAWSGFAYYLEALCELRAADRGLNDLAGMRLPAGSCIERAKDRSYQLGRQVVARAHQQGSLRPDITTEDLAFVVWAHAAVARATRAVAPRAWRRHLALMLDAFRAERAHPLPERPLRPRQVYQAMTAPSTTRWPTRDAPRQ
jgi:AcrR family transcriptional regulator